MKKILVFFSLLFIALSTVAGQEPSKGPARGAVMLFDQNYPLLKDMVDSDYYPQAPVQKIVLKIKDFIRYLETGVTDTAKIQERLNSLTDDINDLQDEFEENGSEIETVARESIAATIEYILDYFKIGIDIETAIRNRDW